MKKFPSVLEGIYDLEIEHIDHLLKLAKKFKERFLKGLPFLDHKAPTLPKTVITYFSENSTRTKISFIQAINYLGLNHINFDVHLSSVKKGEDLKETLLTLKYNHCDQLIYRTSVPQEISRFKEDPPFNIVNAGDGTNQHPTQALLDLFTFVELGLEVKNKTFAIIGDCVHSRVSHSLIDILTLMGSKILLVGPKEFMIHDPIYQKVQTTDDLEHAIKEADYLYPLRIQLERHEDSAMSITKDLYHGKFGVNMEKINRIKPDIKVFHAGPANIGIEISQDVIESPNYLGHEQVKHSIFMRMAILATQLELIEVENV